MTTYLRLTAAAVSALECSGLEDGAAAGDLTAEERILIAALERRGRLAVTADTAPALWAALNDLSNAEDEDAHRATDPTLRTLAGRASRSLAALASRVARIGRALHEAADPHCTCNDCIAAHAARLDE